jgi:hypothetical protein
MLQFRPGQAHHEYLLRLRLLVAQDTRCSANLSSKTGDSSADKRITPTVHAAVIDCLKKRRSSSSGSRQILVAQSRAPSTPLAILGAMPPCNELWRDQIRPVGAPPPRSTSSEYARCKVRQLQLLTDAEKNGRFQTDARVIAERDQLPERSHA